MIAGSTLFAGADAGGSHTEVVVADSELHVLARARGEAGAVDAEHVDEAADRIAGTVRDALRAAATETVPTVLVVGAAGTGRPEERDALGTALEQRHVAESVRITTDAAIALWSVFHDKPGLLLNAGSGSIAYGRDLSGTVWRTGGLGWQFGDEGSGYAIGRAALSAVGKAADGRGPSTALSEAIASAVGADTLDGLVRWSNAASRSAVAGLAKSVQRAALEGDAVARRLAEEAGAELADLVTALVRRYPANTTIPLALAGGVLTEGWPVRRALVDALDRNARQVEIVATVPDPPLGAAALAARAAPNRG